MKSSFQKCALIPQKTEVMLTSPIQLVCDPSQSNFDYRLCNSTLRSKVIDQINELRVESPVQYSACEGYFETLVDDAYPSTAEEEH